MDVRDGEDSLHARIDWSAIRAELAPAEDALLAAFPSAPAPAAPPGQAVHVGWGFDDGAGKANLTIDARVVAERRTPFGWLETLARKGAAAREDGELWRFATDGGAFDVALERGTGVLRELRGRSPNGELRLELATFELGAAVAPERFEVPEPRAGSQDASASFARGLRLVIETALRRRIYAAIAAEPAGERWGAERRARIESVLRPFHERVVAATVAPWRERSARIEAGVAERLRRLREAGEHENARAVRARELATLEKQLSELERGCDALEAPAEGAELPRADELLALEREVVHEVFRRSVREPVLAAFERATAAP
jgi:hypothetical protein